jgi:hypothetical protein
MGSAVRLSQQVFADGRILRAWPTYLASEADHGGPNQRTSSGQPTLTALARRIWPTPNTGDANGGASTKSNQVQLCSVAAPQPGQNLNPEWVESLMGFPPGWTAIDGPLSQEKPKRNGNLLEQSQGDNPIETSA